MEESILKSIKAVLGYEVDDAFNTDIIMHVNTAFATLADLGIGPPAGFEIVDENQKWADFYQPENILDKTLNRVQTYIYLKVKSYFDPPGTPHHLAALNAQIAELEGRLSTHREVKAWLAQSSLPSLP